MSSLVLGEMATVPSHMEATHITLMRFTKTVVNSSLVSAQLVDISVHLEANSTLDSLLRLGGAGNLSQSRGRSDRGGRGEGRGSGKEASRGWEGAGGNLEKVEGSAQGNRMASGETLRFSSKPRNTSTELKLVGQMG